MKSENIYIGNILICTKYPDRYSIKQEEAKFDIYKKNAILIKSGEHYIDLDTINSDLDLVKSKNVLKTYYTYEGDKFVDSKSLIRYSLIDDDKISVKKLKKNKIKLH